MEPPTVDDFGGWRGRPPQTLTRWLKALPCDQPMQVPEEILGDRTADEIRSFVHSAYGRQRGIGSVRKWPDGTVWVLRRSVPKPRRNS